jgi:transcription initiation factor TFIIIB Brf1 subunit/transcription initiation factor TFIIB
MVHDSETWPKCPECGGRNFERRPFASDDIICLNCGYVSKGAESSAKPVNQPVADESEKDASGAEQSPRPSAGQFAL